MKVVIQHDIRDCAATCLSMIALHYGLKYPISKYRELTKTDKTGANLYGIVDGAKHIGLDATALSGSPEELMDGIQNGKITFPFIAHIISADALLHFIVVFGIKNGKFEIGDPARGKITLSFDSFFEVWTGYIVSFKKTNEFKTGNYTKGSFLKFFTLLKGQYHKLIGIMILSVVISVLGIAAAFVFEVVIDEFASESEHYNTENEDMYEQAEEHTHEDSNSGEFLDNFLADVASVNFNVIFASLISLYLIQAGIQFVRGYLIIALSKKIDIELSLSYYNHIVDLPVASVSMHQTGEYLSRLSDTATIRNAISGATLTLLLDSVMVVGCGSILCLMNVKMFAVSLLMIVLYTIIVLLYRNPVENSNRQVMENNAQLQSYFKETIDGFETVKAACAEQKVKEETASRLSSFINSVVKNSFISMTQDTLADTVELIGTALILWIGFGLVLTNQVTIGALITFYVLLSYFTEPIKNLIELQPTIQTAIVAADRLNDILNLQKESHEDNKGIVPKASSVEFQNVYFRYGNGELVLENVSMSIHHGERIAIVGESGSGKTTLVKLLLRFYPPEQGAILVDGNSINDISLSVLRQNIAYVDQNTFLFSDTIKNNLKLGNPNATDKEIEEACRISRADDFISKLPFGYDTPLDENGSNLSGGQRQRLAIARALLKKPQLLILDEATSNLDTITETSIKNTIIGLDERMTCIIIAHRLTTVKNCDYIFVMDRGKVVESGTHEKLINKGGKYSTLWEIQ